MSTPVVLLHPLGVDHHFWDPVRAALPARLGQVEAPDLLGHGRASLPTPGAGIEEFADAVEEGLSAHDAPVHLVGVSLGALVAQVVAARSPERVERLVLADGVAVYPGPMRTMWGERAALVRAQGLGAVVEPMEALWFSPDYRVQSSDQVAAVRALLLAGDPEGYARTCEALAVADTSAAVPSIAAPTLVACGEADAPPFRMALDWLARSLPNARTAWLSGAHATAYEHPGEFADLLVEFLG
ncbi:MAG: alpha/beta fold hydrolase [Nocardioides sp.]